MSSLTPSEPYGTQVFAVPDLVYRSQLERYPIVDWKTGRQEE